MRRGGSLSENLRTKFYGSIYQHQFGYTLNLLPSCLKNGGHLSTLSMVLDFDDYYADFLSIVRSAPDDRPGYLAQRLGIAVDMNDIDVPANVTTKCAQNIDSAMTENVRLVDEMWKQQLQELGFNPEDADIIGLNSAIEDESVD